MFDRQQHLRPNFLSKEEISNLAVSFKQALAESPYRFYERIEPHIQTLFGSLSNKGLMEKLHSEAVADPPAQWLAKMNSIMEIIGPDSDFMSKIMSNRDMRVIIKRSAVPKNMLNGEEINEQIKVVDLKMNSQTLTAPLLDWLFMLIATRLFSSPEVQRRVTEQILFEQDDIFFAVTRSPLLFLLYKYLKHFMGTPEGSRRLFPILEISLMGALTIRTEHFKQSFRSHSLQRHSYENYSNIPYRLRYSHLLAIYLMISMKKEEDLEIYRSYFQSLSENFEVCSSYSSEPNLRLFIRVWLFFMNRKQSVEIDVIVSLGKANSSDGWYNLYRYDVEDFDGPSKSLENRQFYRKVKNNVFRVIQEQEHWKPNLAFLHTFQCLLNFESRQLEKNYSKDTDKHSLIAQKTIERVFQSISQAAHQHTKVKRLKDYVILSFDSIFGQKLSEKNSGKNLSFSSNSTNSEVGDWNTDEVLMERKKYVSFQERRERSCWEYPLQDEELSILFHIFYFIAQAMDSIIPGKKNQHPRVNLRFLCNLPTLIMAIAVVLVCSWLFG